MNLLENILDLFRKWSFKLYPFYICASDTDPNMNVSLEIKTNNQAMLF